MIQNPFFFFFFFFRGVGSLSQPRLNIFTVGNMRVMICLGQEGLRSLSASSFRVKTTFLSSKLTSYNGGYFFRKKDKGIYKYQNHSRFFLNTQCIRVLKTACEVRLSLISLGPEFLEISMSMFPHFTTRNK